MPAAGLTIRHARLTGGGANERERLVAALDRLSLAALGLPPRAMLLLGRVAAPAPLAREGSMEGFVRGLEERLRHRAAHARRGRAATGDGDWLFEDEEALEVALVAAWLERGAATPALLRRVAGNSAPDLRIRWRRDILTDGERTERTIARLAEAGLAETWLAGFEAGELEAACGRILEWHGGDASRTPPPAPPAPPERTGGAAIAPPRPMTARRALARTIAMLVPEVSSMPAGSAARLLASVALVARRRPSLLALPGFRAGVALAQGGAPEVSRVSSRGETSTDRPIARKAIPARIMPHISPARDLPDPIEDGPRMESLRPAPVTNAPTAIEQPEDAPPSLARASRFAGMAFLLNAFVALGLWGDFTRPRDDLAGLSPFELLLLLGRRWYGGNFAADPLHGVLRALAGLRRGEPPGRHFAAPRWAVSADWLAPWGGHPAGFPRDDDRHAARTDAARRRFWIAALARYLDARLAAALGMDDPVAARDLVCRRTGEIVVTPDRLLLRFPLAHHPLAIRIAGLDRDPGRIAGADRSVRFEFTA